MANAVFADNGKVYKSAALMRTTAVAHAEAFQVKGIHRLHRLYQGFGCGLSAGRSAQPLNENRGFQKAPPRELDSQMRKRWKSVEAEILRRFDTGDPELEDEVARQIDAEASLLPLPVVKRAADFTSKKMATMPLSRLLSQREQYESQLGDLRRTYPDASKIRDWLEKHLIETRESALKRICQNIGREIVRREETRDRKRTASVAERGNTSPEVAKRRAIVAKSFGLKAEKLCRQFDSHDVPLPFEGGTSWTQAYRDDPKLRQKIHVILSKDRKATDA